ncbi:thymidine kinase [Candidatus Daviesbacteria bacterium]|nr:thymidine kinase [Candidatus Daviesbacteria bacterium]
MDQKLGRIEIAVGPMFSGKSEWLVSKLRVHQVAKDKILAIRHALDNRYHKEDITSHNDSSFQAQAVKDVAEIKKIIQDLGEIEVLGIDEMQFFETNLADLLLELQKKGVIIYGAGLDLDFAGEPWETTAKIMSFADKVEKLVAVCSVCHLVNATRTQRLTNNSTTADKILVGGKESYTARCVLHHEVIRNK